MMVSYHSSSGGRLLGTSSYQLLWTFHSLQVMMILLPLLTAVSGQSQESPSWRIHLDAIQPRASPEDQTAAVMGLLQRILPVRYHEFSITVDPTLGPAYKDTFKVSSSGGAGGVVNITGSNGVAAASGLHLYLKESCRAHVSWDADQLALPTPLPPADVTITSNDRFRYYQNVCTVSYSSAWWQWPRWEREIDWMALNGINIPLAFTGQEAIWQRVYSQLGLTQEELDAHFAGPAFLAWGRMGNIRGWGGPLTSSWHLQTLALQHMILTRMRNLGMMPVLPGFAGHVPEGVVRVFPAANVSRLSAWGHFGDPYTSTLLLDPSDPLFATIGSMFIKEMATEYNGTDHIYNCDTFNEMIPASGEPSYLSSVGTAIYQGMVEADPKAVWMMQGWLFLQTSFWKPEQAKALLTSVPIGRMLVLDLASEHSPQYLRLDSYFGQPFVFCMLHNYGGVDGFFGNVDVLLQNMMDARATPNITLVGTGLTMEGINQNYVMYDFMSELAWRRESPNISEWAATYAARRYGSADLRLAKAWQLLLGSVYNAKVNLSNHGQYVLVVRPHLPIVEDLVWYSIADVVEAWDLLMAVAQEGVSTASIETDEHLCAGEEACRFSLDNFLNNNKARSGKEKEKEEEGGGTNQIVEHYSIQNIPVEDQGSISVGGTVTIGKGENEAAATTTTVWMLLDHQRDIIGKAGRVIHERRAISRQRAIRHKSHRVTHEDNGADSWLDEPQQHRINTRGKHAGWMKNILEAANNEAKFNIPNDIKSRSEKMAKWNKFIKKVKNTIEMKDPLKINDISSFLQYLSRNNELEEKYLLENDELEEKYNNLLEQKKTAFNEENSALHNHDVDQTVFIGIKVQPDSAKSSRRVTQEATFQHDMIDTTRQILQILASDMAANIKTAYNAHVPQAVQESGNVLLDLYDDLNTLLAASSNFLLGPLLRDAALWATNQQERDLYVYNALNQITLWGPNGELRDYAIKQWAGLTKAYLRPRWVLFVDQLVASLNEGSSFNQTAYEKEVFLTVEEPFTRATNASYPVSPQGDALQIALSLHAKYRGLFTPYVIKGIEGHHSPAGRHRTGQSNQ